MEQNNSAPIGTYLQKICVLQTLTELGSKYVW